MQGWSYGYNAGGLITNINDGATARTYTYDAINQLTGESGGGTSAAWSYDAAGNCLTGRGSGVTNSGAYDMDNELLAWSTMSVTQNVIRGQVAPGPRSNKWYNTWAAAAGRSARVNTTNGSFEIPAVPMQAGSNTLAVTVRDVSGNSATQSVSFIKQSGAGQFCYYDANGNLSSVSAVPSVANYSYDLENRLIGVTSNDVNILPCWYDSAGRRIAKKEIVDGATNSVMYVYDGWTILAVLDGATGALRESYLRGSGIGGDIGTLIAETRFSGGTATNTVYYHNNHRGDMTAVRLGTSTVATFDYAAFGYLRAATGSYNARFRFSSKELDPATGLYYYGHRFYAPTLWRWLTRDPMKENSGYNLYEFCFNNPVSYCDPNGCSPYLLVLLLLLIKGDTTPDGGTGVYWYPDVCKKGLETRYIQVFTGVPTLPSPAVDTGEYGFGAGKPTGSALYPIYKDPSSFEDAPDGLGLMGKFEVCRVCLCKGKVVSIGPCKKWKGGDNGNLNDPRFPSSDKPTKLFHDTVNKAFPGTL